MNWFLFLFLSMQGFLSLCLPIVDPGLFVIMGVRSCGSGKGYCLLGADCTLDEDFLPDEDGGHCDGLQSAFTPRAHFVCCRYNPQPNGTTMPSNEEISTTMITTTSEEVTEPTTTNTQTIPTESSDKLSSYIESLISGIINESLEKYSGDLEQTETLADENTLVTTTSKIIPQFLMDQQVLMDTTKLESPSTIPLAGETNLPGFENAYKVTTPAYINDANTILIKVGEQRYNISRLGEIAEIRMDNTLDEEEKNNEVEESQEESVNLSPIRISNFEPGTQTESLTTQNIVSHEETTFNVMDNIILDNEEEPKNEEDSQFINISTTDNDFPSNVDMLLTTTEATTMSEDESNEVTESSENQYGFKPACKTLQHDSTDDLCWLVKFVDSRNGSVLCAGAFVNPDTILTSAICTIKIFHADVKHVKLTTESDSSTLESAKILDIKVHEEYRTQGHMKILNDIGMVRLVPDSFRRTSSCYLCLPDPQEDFSGTHCKAPLSTTNDKSKSNKQPRMLECSQVINSGTALQCLHSDSRDLSPYKDSEVSGSPLVCGAVLAGVASLTEAYTMYTPVGDYVNWTKINT